MNPSKAPASADTSLEAALPSAKLPDPEALYPLARDMKNKVGAVVPVIREEPEFCDIED